MKLGIAPNPQSPFCWLKYLNNKILNIIINNYFQIN